MPAAVVMGMYRAAVISGEGMIQGDRGLVILEPEQWTGKRLPLLPYIEDGPGQVPPNGMQLRERLAAGEWIVVLYREDCTRCQEELPRYAALADQLRETGSSRQVAAIEVPPYGDGSSVESLGTHAIVYGRLSDQRDWFVETPAVLWIANHAIMETKE